jgi:hypothetical protein
MTIIKMKIKGWKILVSLVFGVGAWIYLIKVLIWQFFDGINAIYS